MRLTHFACQRFVFEVYYSTFVTQDRTFRSGLWFPCTNFAPFEKRIFSVWENSKVGAGVEALAGMEGEKPKECVCPTSA
ncbi:MAG: hypothetical protein K9J81_07890 [Desulfohalobiaceae bacterium]|nr:hypothetical protein [Desulfohalobiaceae bacterium]